MMLIFVNKIFASFLYTGYIRKGGGSIAAAISVFAIYFINSNLIQFFIVSIIILLGTWVSEIAEFYWGHDSYKITIDEVAGMLIAVFLIPHSIKLYFFAFLLFRFFDIFKPFPINHSQSIPGGTGVMMDDILSGIFSNLIIWVTLWLKMFL